MSKLEKLTRAFEVRCVVKINELEKAGKYEEAEVVRGTLKEFYKSL